MQRLIRKNDGKDCTAEQFSFSRSLPQYVISIIDIDKKPESLTAPYPETPVIKDKDGDQIELAEGDWIVYDGTGVSVVPQRELPNLYEAVPDGYSTQSW